MKRQEKRYQILSAAANAFADRGYAETSMTSIAGKVGLRKQSIYTYFESKEDLIYEIILAATSQSITGLRPIVESQLDPIEKFRKAIAFHCSGYGMKKDPGKVYAQTQWQIALRPKRRREIRAMEREYDALFRQILEEGIEKGIFRTDVDVKLLDFIIMGATLHIAKWFSPQGSFSIEEIAGSLASIFLQGFLVTSKTKLANKEKEYENGR